MVVLKEPGSRTLLVQRVPGSRVCLSTPQNVQGCTKRTPGQRPVLQMLPKIHEKLLRAAKERRGARGGEAPPEDGPGTDVMMESSRPREEGVVRVSRSEGHRGAPVSVKGRRAQEER